MVAVSGLVLTYIGYRFVKRSNAELLNREVKSQQVNKTLELLRILKETNVLCLLHHSHNSLSSILRLGHYNLLNIKLTELQDAAVENVPTLSTVKLFIPDDFTEFQSLWAYMTDPLVPSAIANGLRRAFPNNTTRIRRNNLPDTYVVVQQSIALDDKELDTNFPREYPEYFYDIDLSFYDFVMELTNVRGAIHVWLKLHGISAIEFEEH